MPTNDNLLSVFILLLSFKTDFVVKLQIRQIRSRVEYLE